MMVNETGRGYDPFSALSAARQDKNVRTAARAGEEQKEVGTSYAALLEYVQNTISESEDHRRTLSRTMDSTDSNDQLKNIIYTLLSKYTLSAIPANAIDTYTTRIFEDMTGLGLLTPYVQDPLVEEVNIYGPGPFRIEIIHSEKGTFRLKEGFPDAQAVLNVVKRMVRMGGMVIDQRQPRVDSYMEGGTRVSAMIAPVIREDMGAVASIRKQTKSRITRDAFIKANAAMPEEYALMELLTRNKISGAIVGATGSGKTTLLNYLMSDYVNSNKEDTRVYIIEESRELQLPEDAKVIYTAVVGSGGETTSVTAPELLKSALRFHPTFISCAEMRGEEAMNAMTAAQTGHIVWSTFHADNCEDAYQRLLTMCKMSGTNLSEHLLMRNLVKAFPIIVSSQQMKDGTRKITGIYEAEGVDGVSVVGHYIYKIQISEMLYDSDGKCNKVRGRHCRVGDLSDAMAQQIFDNCGRLDLVRPFARTGWTPEKVSADIDALSQSLEF